MPAQKIDGKRWASLLAEEDRQVIVSVTDELGRQPGLSGVSVPSYTPDLTLTVILVGNRPDSATYVRMKEKACGVVGIRSHTIRLEEQVILRIGGACRTTN